MKPPAFQFYPDDFLGGTLTMSLEERGFYITLLCIQWSKGFVAADDFDRLGGALAEPSRRHVRGKFTDDGAGGLRNQRLEAVRQQQAEYRANRAEAGRAGAERRWHSHGTAIAQPSHSHGTAMAQPKLSHQNDSLAMAQPSHSHGTAIGLPMAKHSTPTPTPTPELIHAGKPAKPVPGERELFEALAKAEGSDPAQLTKPARDKIRHAMATILAVCPVCPTPWEIEARVKRYGEVMPNGAKLTAHALAANWAKCATTPPPPVESNDGPDGWLTWLNTELSVLAEDHPARGQLLYALNSRKFSGLPASWKARCNSQLRQA